MKLSIIEKYLYILDRTFKINQLFE